MPTLALPPANNTLRKFKKKSFIYPRLLTNVHTAARKESIILLIVRESCKDYNLVDNQKVSPKQCYAKLKQMKKRSTPF